MGNDLLAAEAVLLVPAVGLQQAHLDGVPRFRTAFQDKVGSGDVLEVSLLAWVLREPPTMSFVCVLGHPLLILFFCCFLYLLWPLLYVWTVSDHFPTARDAWWTGVAPSGVLRRQFISSLGTKVSVSDWDQVLCSKTSG